MVSAGQASEPLEATARRILDELCRHPNQRFSVEQIAQLVGCSEADAAIQLEALAYRGEIEKERDAGGHKVYYRPRKT
ncbi:hypothetical protein [Kallotenue papyrolyticum]|uniref:hypothetical protein n=1 Tax=Kallotenue papyrolyticum TaxID=1325125 RepID=UPI000478613E|nr:hypothetical protein [Kallotenue papyrolyticum]